MEDWVSCRSEEQKRCEEKGQSTFDESEEEQWRRLKEEAMIDSDDSEGAAGDEGAVVLAEAKRRKPRKSGKVIATQKCAQPQNQHRHQQKLTKSLSTYDMENLLKQYRNISAEEEDEVDVDITKFLQDDGVDSEDGEGPSVTATELLSSLISGRSADTNKTEELADSFPLANLNDEVFTYENEAAVKKTPRNKEKRTNKSGANYVIKETVVEELNVVTDLPVEVRTGSQHASTDFLNGCPPKALFYWFDAKEQPHTLTAPGTILLFGKVCMNEEDEEFRSCCVRIQHVHRNVFLLPKEGSTDAEVVQEINAICRGSGIEERRIKFVERYYAFEEPGVPREKNRWAKLVYPGRYPPFPNKGGLTHVQVVVGASRSLLELFLIKKRLMGPSYLEIEHLVTAMDRVSHCKTEFLVPSPKDIKVYNSSKPPPPFTVASIQLHAQLDSDGVKNEVIAASIALYGDVSIDGERKPNITECFTGVRQLSPDAPLPLDLETYCLSKRMPGVHRFINERALLTWFAETLAALDPDIIVGHNIIGYTVETLLNRYQELNIVRWSTIGRLDVRRFPRIQGNNFNLAIEKEACVGRLVVDTYLLAREYYKSTNYKLLSLSTQMEIKGITDNRGHFEPGSTVLVKDSMMSSEALCPILLQLLNCAVLSFNVASFLDVIPLTKRLTLLAGNLWSRTLYGARSERIEYLLLHAFHNLKFVTPDKKKRDLKRGREDDDDEGKRKTKYQGGMVLEPKSGLYSEYILLLDFNSLYPSLIQEFNVCYTTIDRDENTVSAEVPPPESLICLSCRAAGLPSPCLHKCILPKVIRGLVDSRREIKRMMKSEKDPGNLAMLEIRQLALKLTANSMYGCLGFEYSRFYAQPLAELVTRQGRLALQNTVELIPQISPSIRVIYGDTDSVMIQTGIKDDIVKVRNLGFEIKGKVNQRYQSLELDIDGVFRAMLLLRKKKYAALSVVDWQGEGKVYKREVKGLDMVRRDWCPLSQHVSDAVLKRILNAEGGEDILDFVIKYMKGVAQDVRSGNVYPLEEFVISKSLTKEPESYHGTGYPHAVVALRMKQRKEGVRVGDLIPYVICEGDEHIDDKAYHIDEVRRSDGLSVDVEWYLSSQLYPPVMRLCEHIQGFVPEQLSEAMCIASHMRTERDVKEEDTANDFSHCSIFKSRALSECFPTATALQVQCTHCQLVVPVDPHKYINDMFSSREKPPPTAPFELYVCFNCGRSLPLAYLANCMTQMCHTIIRQFYCSGGNVASVRALRAQFTYLRAMFDVPQALNCPSAVKNAHRVLSLRCLGTDRKLYTLADVERFPDVEPVDPLLACAESFYRRIDHLFVSLDKLFDTP
ncbi:DNA polymerase I, putative [Trypanosoma brucei gambiense DAL972]|uniref:DNA polymerase n=1 Tax=Trypanosoma brucei gambiense (strain MHOM/CI/86/DAL972) TaxID=679716 RepID=C9ZVT9_TRYB9|nr:DNA polymerase I, putative [Trypanosoma brucei gambiense DAL972]CBH13527.1 DNA polymerase I, putative [Trypanosoma brucei gambiense DAL972]|eukprot:XP_011775804.1 DNA polymerase I, putative [Trypanosoma brucei gambiense DAL972]